MLKEYKSETESVRWKSPSNIALVKYWGKKEGQIPANPSLSFTLDNALTETSIHAQFNDSQDGISLNFLFENQENKAFETKLIGFLTQAAIEFSWLNQFHLQIQSSNTFPHSSGIASSASAFSALSLGICSLHEQITGEKLADFFQKASFWARLGSGSACRSVYGGYNVWGQSQYFEGSSDQHALHLESGIHPVFNNFKDTVLIIEKGQKAVSSTKGHALLKEHPFAETRYQLARENMKKLKDVLNTGDLNGFIDIVEAEALMLHALMMTSPSPFILMKPHTLAVIEKVKDFRNQTGSHLLFTLDAGANVHLLNPASENAAVQDFVKNECVGFCQNAAYFCNSVGSGPTKL